MNLVPSFCAEVQALGQLRLELPATAHVLALRLSEIGDLPLSSIRDDRSRPPQSSAA